MLHFHYSVKFSDALAMEFISRIWAPLIICICLLNSQVVICQNTTEAANTTEATNTTVQPETTATTTPINMTTSNETMTTSNETMTTMPATTTPSVGNMTSETTPQIQTTVTPEPTFPPAVPKHYSVKNKNETCLVMDATFVFTIPYIKNDDTEAKATVPVPPNATASGECSQTDDSLSISFFEDTWQFTIDIHNDANLTDASLLMADDNVNYSWKRLTLTYVIDDNFPDARDTGAPKQVESSDLNLFESSSQGSYKCVQSQSVDIADNVTLAVSDFQYRAFGTTESDDYPDSDVDECPADKKKDDDDNTGKIVGIVVGSVVGGLILIAIIGCLIQRARRRGSYEKV